MEDPGAARGDTSSDPKGLLARVLADSSDAVAISSLEDRRLLYVNDALCALVGYARDELLGHTLSEYGVIEHEGFTAEVLGRLRVEGSVSGVRFPFQTRTGEPRVAVFNAHVLRLDGKPAVLTIGRDVTHDEELHRRGTILEAAAFVASAFLRAETWESVMDDALGRLGQASGAQRTYLYENVVDATNGLRMRHRFEWNAQGVQRSGELGRDYAYFPRFARWAEVLGAGGVIRGSVASFPEPERGPLVADGVRSTVAVPIQVGGAWWGFVGFDDLQTEYAGSQAEVDALRVAAEALGAAIEQRSLQTRLAQVEFTHQQLIERLPGVVYIESLEEGSPDIYLSPQYREVYGEDPQTRLDRPEAWRDLIHPDDVDNVMVESARSNATDAPFFAEYRICRPDATIRWVRDECVLIHDTDGAPLYWLGLVTDLTVQREAEERSRVAEERFRALVEHIPVATYIESMDGTPGRFYISPQIERITGWPPQRFEDSAFWESNLHPDDREAVLAEERRCDAAREPFAMEYRYLRPDGSVVWLAEESQHIVGPGGERLSQGVMADITERKDAEARLRAAEERYRTLLERLPVITYQEVVAPSGYPAAALTYLSPQFEATVGTGSGVLDSGTFWASVLHPDDHDRVMEASAAAVRDGEALTMEYRVVTVAGAVVWFQDRSVLTEVLDDGAQVWQGVLINITERMRAEEQSRRADAILRATSAAAEQMLQAVDWRSQIQASLAGLGQATGMSRAYLFEIRTDADGLERAWETYEWVAPGVASTMLREANQGWPVTAEDTAWQIRMRAGHTDYGTPDDYPGSRDYLLDESVCSVLSVPLIVDGRWWGHLGFDDCVEVRTWTAGEVEALQTAARTIAAAIERQHTMERLGESEATQQELIDRLPGVVYMASLDDDLGLFYVSPQYETLFGFTPEERIADRSLWMRLVHPEDGERVVARSRESHRDQVPFTEEYRMFNRDGELRWVRDEAVLVRDADGQALYWLGLITDLTERNRTQEELRRHDAILGSVGFAAARFLGSAGWEEPLQEVLHQLGEAGEASRCYLFRTEVGVDGRTRGGLFAEWCAPGVQSQVANPRLQAMLVGSPTQEGVPTWAQVLGDGGVVRIDAVSELEDVQERAFLQSQDVRSLLEVPIFVGGDWWGWIGFDDCVMERRWSQAEVDALLAAAGLLGAVVERLEAEGQLRVSEERQRMLIERMPAVVYLEDMGEDSATVYVSHQVEEMLGYTPEERLAGPKLWKESLHPDDRARVVAESDRVNETLEPFAMDYRMVARDGSVKWIRDESRVVYGEDGEPLYWQGVLIDITERKRAEEELERTLQLEREAVERLRALDELKNTFLTAVSHDLRTPLAAVLGLALTLERDDIQLEHPEIRDLAHRIAMNARKLDRLVTDLLDLDRLSRGIFEPNLSRTDLGLLARKAVEEADFLGDHNVIVEADSVELRVDTAKVERIIENLLANTVRHTPRGTNVWVRVRAEGSGALLMVEDDGPGVSPDLREVVFEPFRQGGESLGHSPGVGIGLSLVARFAELHEGRAWVAEREGGGASFRVFLPDAPAPPASHDGSRSETSEEA